MINKMSRYLINTDNNKLLIISISLFALLFGSIDCLGKYCQSVNRDELFEKLENCTNSRNSDYSSSSLSSTSTSSSSLSSSIKSNYNTIQFKQNYQDIKFILDKVLTSVNDVNTTKNETKHLFLDILRLVKLANSDSDLKFCFTSICNFFKNCEFPIDIEYKNFENDALVAARIASLLTAINFNEKIENKTYLNKLNIYSLLRTSITENENIYDCKIAFFRTSDQQERFAIHATKSYPDKNVEVKDLKIILENTKNFQWYYKWLYEKKLPIFNKTNTAYKLEDLKSTLEMPQLRTLNQMYYPTSLELNANRYVSNITYDCYYGIWSRIVSVPFLNPNGDIRGVVSVSISLNHFDLKQCGEEEEEEEEETEIDEEDQDRLVENDNAKKRNKKRLDKSRDPFYDTDKCDRQTTKCINVEGNGFVLDSYECECKPGYYRNKNISKTGFSNISSLYSCLKCSDGCERCEDDRPCKIDIPMTYKKAALIINLVCIFVCIILVILTWYHMTLKVLKTSSPKMLFMVLFGAIVSYSEIIPMYFQPNYWTCTAAQILQLEGFLLAYGALVLKTWRECKLFYVRSVKTIKITDQSLMKRLGIIMLIGTTYLIAWALRRDDSPKQELKYDPIGLKYETCTVTEWNFVSMAIQLAILLWGAVLSVQVRRASIAFKETKLITWAIFNEGVVLCFVISINVLLKNTKVSCYIPFTISFIRIHLTITVMLLLLFSYKIYTVILARKKPFQANQTGLLNVSISGKDGEQKSSSVHDETDKERELKVEIQRLYRQIEEMRSLSMRIANPHLIPKKSRFGYQTKKSKLYKSKNAPSENEISKVVMSNHEPELQSFIATENQGARTKKLVAIDESK